MTAKTKDFTQVRIPNDLLAEVEQLAPHLVALPKYAQLGTHRGATTALVRLALGRGVASLRREALRKKGEV